MIYDWLINYIHEPIRKSAGCSRDKIVSLFRTNTPKQTVYERGKIRSKPIRNPFILKKKKNTLKMIEISGHFLKQKKKKKGLKKLKKKN